MSKKINPISNKLGVLRLWQYNLQGYGRNFKNYNELTKLSNYTFIYLKQYLNKNSLLLENIHIIQTFSKTTIEIFIFDLKNHYTSIKKTTLSRTISYWLNYPVTLTFYKKNYLGSSTLLINSYMVYLLSKRISTPKKVLQLVLKLLKNQLYKTKVIYTSQGVKRIQLKGFKIEIRGCFESSRNQMAKSIKCNFGSLPLMKLSGHIDYSSNTFFTKFGSCGLKIWLFYELTN